LFVVRANQPTIFGNSIVVGVSSIDDGSMRFAFDDESEVRQNRINFLRQLDIDPTQATLVQVSYEDTTDFTRYRIVDDENLGEGILAPISGLHADALVVTRPDQALFLPLADCIGAVIYDPEAQVMMVSHLGRHSVEADGALKSIRYLEQEFGTVATDVKIWLSPAVGGDSYPLHAFNGRSLQEVVCEQFERAGVGLEQIEASDIDTSEDDNYFSHSEYLAGNQMTDGRFAIVAMMRD
jgi:copper oxidase (laccase) domain-containing protein